MKKIYFILIIITVLVLGGCGKDEIKPSVDSLTAQEALRITDILRTAYEAKDQDTLKENMSPEVTANILEELFFEKAELFFITRIIKITDSSVAVNINWHGMWVVKNKTLKDMGSAILVFQSRSMKLIQIDGDNPFHVPLLRER